jgi:tRNA(Ile)-lysidine synthase
LPFVLREYPVEDLSKEWGMSTEEAGRKVRYEAFSEVLNGTGKDGKIAVAHNKNDVAETVLFHLFRGSSTRGLSGIHAKNGNVVRPILCFSREEIEKYLEENGLSFCIDKTNLTDDYTRNKIRNHILPYAEKEIAGGVLGNMSRAADIFAEEESYMARQTNAAGEECLLAKKAGEFAEIKVDAFLENHPVIQKRLLHLLLKELSPQQRDITFVHIEDVLSLFVQPGNRQIHLPYGIRAKRSYGSVCLERQQQCLDETYEFLIPRLNCPGDAYQLKLPGGGELRFVLLGECPKESKNRLISENRYTKRFDYDKIIESFSVRTRKIGDYLTIRGEESMKHKKLKDYMVTEKIPQELRDKIPVLAEGEHVIWLVGYRISEYYKVKENTKRILSVQWVQGEEQQWQNV